MTAASIPGGSAIITTETSDHTRSLNSQVVGLIIATALAGAVLAAAAAIQWDSEDLLLLAVLAGFAAFSVRFDVALFYQSRVSVTVVPILVAATLAGLPGLLVVALAAELAAYVGRGKPYYKSVFNAGALLLSGAAYLGFIEVLSPGSGRSEWPNLLALAMAGALVNFLVNSSLVGLAISLSSRRRFVSVWKENYGWLPPHYVILGVLVAAMAFSYEMKGIAALSLVFVPVIIMRFGLQLQRAHKELEYAHDQVSRAAHSLKRAYDDTLQSLLAALDNRDNNTGGHSERVAELALAIAGALGIRRGTSEWDEIRSGALLHDVGKIAVPDAVLHKAGALTGDEWEHMRRHPQVGFEIVNRVELLSTAANIILAHHERFDGAGYPSGAAGEEIPLAARIFAVADAYDAMTSDRPYREAMPVADAIEEICRCSGSQFDPTVVDAFLKVSHRFNSGHGHSGEIAASHSALPSGLLEGCAPSLAGS